MAVAMNRAARLAEHRERVHRQRQQRGSLDGLSTTHADQLRTLMTLNFQRFENVSLMPA
jgi:hypothetical protein